MTSRARALPFLSVSLVPLLLANSACDSCKKSSGDSASTATSPPPNASGAATADAHEPMILGIDASGPVIPPPKPTAATVRPPTSSADVPGVCKTDANCPVKDGKEQLCCISTTAPGGPGLFCEDRSAPCQKPCVTDADCRVGKRCDLVKGTASGVILRGCF